MFVHVINASPKALKPYQDNLCAIEMYIDDDREQRCFDNLVKVLEGDHLVANMGENLGDAWIVTSRANAPKAIKIAKRLSRQQHFTFFDLTNPVVAESVEPLTKTADPVQFCRMVATDLKLGADAPTPILIAAAPFKARDLVVEGDATYACVHALEKVLGTCPT